MKKSYFYLVVFFLIACKNKRKEVQQQEKNQHFVPFSEQVAEETYPTDTAYNYENRVGVPGDYQYTYDVSGTNENGEEVTGTTTVRDNDGEGTVTDSEGNEMDVEAEWIGYGKLKAADDDGNEYELEVD
jgi:predicted membrane-bound dolichyl-phosphate-mannose-protein mannosyltransferase